MWKLSLILSICVVPNKAFASGVSNLKTTSEGEAYTFKSVSNDDTNIDTTMNFFDLQTSMLKGRPPVLYSRNVGGYTLECLDDGSYTNSKEFIKYLTTSWAKSSQYVWSESQTTTWTFSGSVTIDVAKEIKAQLGLSSSRTTTYGVSVTIPADSSRYSKLGFYQDMFHQDVILKSFDNLTYEITRCDSGSLVTPLENSYLIVKYQ